MKTIIRSIITFNFTLILFSNIYAQDSYIQVVSEPGLSIYLNDVFKGKTASDVGGLIIEKISSGSHKIKVVKEGYNTIIDEIFLKGGEVYTYRVRPLVPSIKIQEEGKTEQGVIKLSVGNLKIQSLPISISIEIPSLGVNNNKTKDEWNAFEIPEGVYDAIFIWNGKKVKYSFQVKSNQLTHLFVNMLSESIEDRSPIPPKPEITVFTDPRDGSVYNILKFGEQRWMAENLKYAIPNSYCYNNWESYGKEYGRLYDWETALDVCPEGWHLPSFGEFEELFDFFGGKEKVAYYLKKDFKTKFGGLRDPRGGFDDIDRDEYWWTSRAYNKNTAKCWLLNPYQFPVYEGTFNKKYCFSVRCIKDK